MQIYLDCLPCNLRQVLEASRMTGCDEATKKEIALEAVNVLHEYDKYRTAPEIARAMQKIVNDKTGVYDAYKEIKKADIETAKKLKPKLQELISKKEDKLYWSIKAAAVGNVLDSAVVQQTKIEDSLVAEFEKDFAISDYDKFKEKIKDAKNILIIGDNCGETVFDTILMENLPKEAVITYATRNIPVINDVTIQEAKDSGIEEYAKIISSGSNYPGTVLEGCSEEFLELFKNADVVISKGQGNFETMSESGREIFYVLKAKCPVVAKLLDVPVASYIFKLI